MKNAQKPAVSFASQNFKTSLSYENLQKLQTNVVNFLSYQTDTKTKNSEQMFEDFFVRGFEKFLKFNDLQGKKLNEESFILDGEVVNMNYLAYLQKSELISNVRNCEESPLQNYATKKAKEENISQYLQEILYDKKVMVAGRREKIGTLVEVTQTKKISYIKDLNLFADSKELFFVLVKYAKQAFFNDVKNKPKVKDIDNAKVSAKVSETQNYTIDNDFLQAQTEKSIFEIFDKDEEECICEANKYQIVLKINNSSSVVCVPKNLKTTPTIKTVKKRLEVYIKFFKKQLKQEGKSIEIVDVREIPCDKYDTMKVTEVQKTALMQKYC